MIGEHAHGDVEKMQILDVGASDFLFDITQ